MNNHRQEFISTIQKALGKKSALTPDFYGTPPENVKDHLLSFKNKTRQHQEELLELFIKQASQIHMEIIPVKTEIEAGLAIGELAESAEPEWGTDKSIVAWSHPLIDRLNLEEILTPMGIDYMVTAGSDIPVSEERKDIRQKTIESFIGITSADFCVAQSAALVQRSRPNQPRSTSLVPSVHVAVTKLDQMVKNLEELYFRLKWDPAEQETGLTNCMTFISGPSKTADIELVMVHGAHGPKRLIVYVITG